MSKDKVRKLSIRVPEHLWGPISHRLVDELVTWQSLLTPVLERYAAGEDITAPPSPRPAQTEPTRRPFEAELAEWLLRSATSEEKAAISRALKVK